MSFCIKTKNSFLELPTPEKQNPPTNQLSNNPTYQPTKLVFTCGKVLNFFDYFGVGGSDLDLDSAVDGFNFA